MAAVKIILLATLSYFFVSLQAYGLGLGELMVHSKLGQPLHATAMLLDTGSLDASQLKATQAEQTRYRQLGIDTIARRQNLRFAISDEQPMRLTISTDAPMTEPMLHLLLHIRWPDGQLLKELTILLDPPSH